jgi:hypothetical protein
MENKLLSEIRGLDLKHREDGDGGYILLAAMIDYVNKLDIKDRVAVRDIFYNLVKEKDNTLWGIALEVLVREGVEKTCIHLGDMFVSQRMDDEWMHQLSLALIRLNCHKYKNEVFSYVDTKLKQKQYASLVLLANSLKMDKEYFIQNASLFFGELKKESRENIDRIKHYIPAFVRNIMEVSIDIFEELLQATKKIDEESCSLLKELLSGYFDNRYVINEIGESKKKQIVEIIKAA